MAETNPQLSEILRQILNRMAQLETEFRGTQSREGDLANNMANLQRAQTTVQQSLNLLQAAHNALHETMGGAARSRLQMDPNFDAF